jgi:hypothetical protein
VTDTVFYDEMFKLAGELMNDFGTPATLREVTQPKPDASGKSVPTFVDTPGLAVRIHDMSVLTALGLAGDVGYALKFPAEPKPDFQLIHAGETWLLEKVTLVNPEGSRLMMGFATVKRA